jgi:hypothetical protein
MIDCRGSLSASKDKKRQSVKIIEVGREKQKGERVESVVIVYKIVNTCHKMFNYYRSE